VPADDGVGLHDLQAGAPTRPAAREQDPQPSVRALQEQTRWRILVEHDQLVTKGENPRARKLEAKKAKRATKTEFIVDATIIPRMMVNLCVFKSDGVFSMHTPMDPKIPARAA
jgi:hypothetical protein